MKIVSYQLLSEPKPRHFISECGDGDNCPSCGAGYKVGMSACEYCREPVRADTKTMSAANVSGVLVTCGTLSDAQRRYLVNEFNMRYSGYQPFGTRCVVKQPPREL